MLRTCETSDFPADLVRFRREYLQRTADVEHLGSIMKQFNNLDHNLNHAAIRREHERVSSSIQFSKPLTNCRQATANREQMPRTALRCANERPPANMRMRAMKREWRRSHRQGTTDTLRAVAKRPMIPVGDNNMNDCA